MKQWMSRREKDFDDEEKSQLRESVYEKLTQHADVPIHSNYALESNFIDYYLPTHNLGILLIWDRDIIRPSGVISLILSRRIRAAENQGIDILQINEEDTNDEIDEKISSKIS